MKRYFLSAAVLSLIVGTVVAKPRSGSGDKEKQLVASANIKSIIPANIVLNDNYKVEYRMAGDDSSEGDPQDIVMESYDMTLRGKNFKGDAVYDANGQLLGYRETVKDAMLPKAVAQAILSKYPGSRFTKDEEVIKDRSAKWDEYKVYFVEGKKHGYAVVDADGHIIHSRNHIL